MNIKRPSQVSDTGPESNGAKIESRGRVAPINPRRNALTLARLMSAYIVVAVGRIGDLLPGMQQIPLAKVVVVLAIISVMRLRENGPSAARWRTIPPARIAMGFMALTTLSILFSTLRSATFATIIGTVLAVVASLILTIRASRDWRSVKTILHGIVFASVVLVVTAFSSTYAGRAGSSNSYDPNDFAFVLVGLLPVVVTFGVVSRGAKRLTYFGVAGLVIFAILLTESRGGLLGLIFDFVAMTFLLPIARRGKLQFRTSKSQVIARVLALTLIGVVGWQLLPQAARVRLDTITELGSDYNANVSQGGRVAIWTRNLPLVLVRPWGYGAGAFAAVDGLFAGGKYRAPHNTFLQALVEVGVLGFALFIATIVSSLRYLRVTADPWPQNALPDEPRAFARALGIGLLGLCISGFFLSQLYANVFWTFVTLSCAVGIVRRIPYGLGATAAAGSAVRNSLV